MVKQDETKVEIKKKERERVVEFREKRKTLSSSTVSDKIQLIVRFHFCFWRIKWRVEIGEDFLAI